MEPARVARRLGMDAALWYCAPAVFLLLYVGRYSKPATAIEPHLLLLALPLLLLMLARLVLARPGVNATFGRVAAAVLTATVLAALMIYYCIVLVGLGGWGGVVAWNVIPTFFAQASVMLDALGVSPQLAACVLMIGYAGLSAGCWFYLKHFDWAAELARGVSGWTLAALVVCGSGIVAIEIYQLTLRSWTLSGEPVSLTLFPPGGALDLEGYSVNPLTASNLDRLEDAARSAYRPTAVEPKNVILIIVDGLRPDHMGIYGYPRETTPNLVRISKEQPTRIVPEVHSSCGDTICAMFSLFSSKFPREFSFRPFTLQDVLRVNGYRVHMILSGDHTFFYSLKSFYGHVDSFYDGTQAHGYFMNDDRLVLDHLAAMPAWDGVPAMFQFHLMSAHILRRNDVVPGKFQPAARYVFHDSRDTGSGGLTPQSAVNFYDNGVLGADSIVNDLLKTLQAKGYLRNALVVITSDHGESLGEHGLFHHANSVREELLHIPLVLISFGYQPSFAQASRAFPSQVDIAPTILADLGLPRPQTWSGRPLQESGPDFSYFEEQTFAGLIDHRDPHNVWKYWINRTTGRDHVFNLSADPREDHDLSHGVPAALLSDWRGRTVSLTSVALAIR